MTPGEIWQDPPLYRLLRHASHHFFVALVVASAVFILEQKGLLNWLDSIALRTSASISAGNPAADDHRLQAAPKVMLIGDKYYERHFKQGSRWIDANSRAW